MSKIFKLLLLLVLFLAIVGFALLQTASVQERVRGWLETRLEGRLTIGKLDGILPLYVHLHDVSYTDETTKAHFERVDLYLSPTSLLFGHLSIFRLKIDQATVETESSEPGDWPSLPLLIHSLHIDTLLYNGIEIPTLSGRADLREDFSIQLDLSYHEALIRLALEGDEETQTVAINAQISAPPNIKIWLKGVYGWDSQSFDGKLEGAYDTWRISSRVALEDSLLTLPDLHIGNDVIAFSADARYNLLTHTFKADQIVFDNESAFDFSAIGIEGTWRGGALIFHLTVEDFNVLDPAYEVFPTTSLSLDVEASRTHIWLRGEVSGLGEAPFVLLADIPTDRNAPFSIRLKGSGSIDPLLAFLENASIIARGDMHVDLTMRGTWDDPEIIGSLVYTNGEFESLETGALFRGIHMELEGEGRRLVIRSMVAHDTGRGDLSGMGWIEWDPEGGFPFALRIGTHRFTLLANDPIRATLNASLDVTGTIEAISVVGTAEVVEAHLAIPSKIPPQVPTLEVTYVNPLPTPKPEIPDEKKVIPITWDVQISIPENFIIEGRGLVSEWRGSIAVSGPQEAPSYSGKLKLVQGRFSVVGRSFDLTEGQIQIEGLEPRDIYVDVKGDLELATITASIIITGSLDDARLTFSSSPPMSTNEILSWILFNQSASELSPFQAARLANTLVALSGKYAGPKVFDQIKEGLGIDVFDITNCDLDSSDLTFQVGKYISQGTFVGVRKSISGDFDSVLIQTRLYRNFYLEADYGGSLNGLTPNGGKMIFKWYKTY